MVESEDDVDVSVLTVEELAMMVRPEDLTAHGFTISLVDDSLLVYLIRIRIVDNIPDIAASVCVKSEHSVVVTVDRKVVPASQYKDLLIQGQLKLVSQLTNLMEWVNAKLVASKRLGMEL